MDSAATFVSLIGITERRSRPHVTSIRFSKGEFRHTLRTPAPIPLAEFLSDWGAAIITPLLYEARTQPPWTLAHEAHGMMVQLVFRPAPGERVAQGINLLVEDRRIDELMNPALRLSSLGTLPQMTYVDRLQETVLLPVLNICEAWRTSAIGHQPRLRAEASRLKYRVQGLLDELGAAQDNNVDIAVPTGADRGSRPRRSSAVAQIVQDKNNEWHIASLAIQGRRLDHRLSFAQQMTPEQILGDTLGSKIREELDGGMQPYAVTALPDFVYEKQGVAINGMRLNVMRANTGMSRRSAMVELCQLRGLPEAVRHLGPWPDIVWPEEVPTPSSVIYHVRMLLEATAQLVVSLAEWPAHQLSAQSLDTMGNRIRYFFDMLVNSVKFELGNAAGGSRPRIAFAKAG